MRCNGFVVKDWKPESRCHGERSRTRQRDKLCWGSCIELTPLDSARGDGQSEGFFWRWILAIALFLAGNSYAQQARYYYAAVYSNADNPSVGSINNNGVFRRAVNDTGWIKIRANFYAFGLGHTHFGSRSQQYIAGGNGLHRSTDGGATWKVLTGWQTKEILSVAPDPVDSLVIYVATPFGIFKSTDGGEHWTEAMKGFKTSYTRHVVIDRTNHHTLYAAAEDALYKSTNAGNNWKVVYSGNTEIKCVLQLPNDAERLLIGTEDKGIQLSTDGGQHWKAAAGIPQSAIYCIGSTADGATLYAGGYKTGVWKSDNKGESWSQVWSAPEVEAIYCMFIDPKNANHLLVGTNGKGIFESNDYANTWRQAGLPRAHVKQIEFYP